MRPISLLNVELKLLTKIIASRIQQHLPGLIHLDQVGFVPSREARDNTAKVLNLLHAVNVTKTPCVFVGTDAEKAFARVNWQFMFATLRHVGLGHKMLNWISAVYTNPTAKVRAVGDVPDYEWDTTGLPPVAPIIRTLPRTLPEAHTNESGNIRN